LTYYYWRGKRITNIQQWAEERGERLVSYRAERTVPNMVTGTLDRETDSGIMPESCWHNLHTHGGWCYTEVSFKS